ncbi:MAG: hypothetical protein RSD54_08945, partial [Ruthenibacterium sp.]
MLGRKSMGIYIISSYMALYVFSWLASYMVNNLFVYEWFITPIIAGTVIAICLLAVWLIEKNKVLNQCLLGNRKIQLNDQLQRNFEAKEP